MTDQISEANTESAAAPSQNVPSKAPGSLADIRAWLTSYLAFLLEQEPNTINTKLSFDSHGIDSAAAVSLVADLEDWMGIELDPTIVYDYPSVDQLADFLMTRLEGSAA
jgi:acyl carrier protein